MNFKNSYSFSKYTIVFIAIVTVVLIYFYRWQGDKYTQCVDGDGKDYYSYLITIFIKKNLGHQDTNPWYVIQTPTGTINVHSVGESLLLAPFFGLGYLWAYVRGAELDGLSYPFQKMVSIGALFYLIVGLYFLRKLLIAYNIKDKTIAAVLLLIYFGTNLLYYSIIEPSMAHVYSFGLITTFMYYIHKFFKYNNYKSIYIASFILGLIILVRPVNAIVVLMAPFMAASFVVFKESILTLFKTKKQLIISVLIFGATLFIQSIVWYTQNKQFIQWSYKGNGFYFDNPRTLQMLFSFDSGFFIYTPLCFLILFGLIPLFKNNKFQFLGISFFLLFSFYLFSCYWAHTYFDSIGIRTFVDYYALFALLLAILFTHIKKYFKPVLIPLTVIALFFNVIFCYQYQAYILLGAGMNYKKFKYIFLKTDEKKYGGCLGGCNDLEPYHTEPPKRVAVLNSTDVYNYNGNEYGPTCKVDSFASASNKIHVKVELDKKDEIPDASTSAFVVLHLQYANGENKNYQAYKLNDIPEGNTTEWEKINLNITMGDKINKNDKLSVYVLNGKKANFLVKNIKIEVLDYNFKTT